MPKELYVDFPPFVIWRSRAIWPDSFAGIDKPIEYKQWEVENRLEVLEINKSSSIIGPSTMKLRAASGQPIAPQVEPEDSDDKILSLGDRIVVGFNMTQTSGDGFSQNKMRWIFGGYAVTAALLIDDNVESMTWLVVGPEWHWGTDRQSANAVVYGQYRRNHSADDAYAKALSTVSKRSDLARFTDLRALFNPDGRKNMSTTDVELTTPGQAKTIVKGRCFEEPDRKVQSTDVAELWNALEATKMLATLYNNFDVTRITTPDDWDAVPMKSGDVLKVQDGQRGVDLDGQSLFSAMTSVLHPRFAFFVDPVPQQVSGTTWGPFTLKFFSRSRTDDAVIADLQLNARGTLMSQATPSVARIEAARDISKLNNRAVVAGKFVRHVRLYYWGAATPTLSAKLQKTSLQQLWKSDDGKVTDYGGADTLEGSPAVNAITIDASNKRDEYLKRYVVTGTDHVKYADVFRRFGWNEANEFSNGTTHYGQQPKDWYAPDLDDIADVTDDIGDHTIETRKSVWTRRRRPVLDSIFLEPGSADSWQRMRPTLYIAIADTPTSVNVANWKWRKVPDSHWQLEEHRAGFRMTVDDLAEWRPFHKQDKDAQQTADQTANDPRTFATLLAAGSLRLCLEGSVEVDHALESIAQPTDANGSAYLREVVTRAGATFIKTLSYNDGFTSPSQLTPTDEDRSSDATQYAELLRDAGQEQKVHASIVTDADWPEQEIGSFIETIGGTREINLKSNDAGRGAQIVAIRYDIQGAAIEYLTETAALAQQEKDRRRFESGTRIYGKRSDKSFSR